MNKNTNEVALIGGQMTPGVVRLGDTVRRPLKGGESADFRHKLLQLLEEQQYQFAPKFLGIDDQNREILSYIDGQVVHQSDNIRLSLLAQVAHALRQYHDFTVSSKLAQDGEVICHNDLAPWNTVRARDGSLAGFIDFDAAAPGRRLDDLGYMIWTFLDLGSNQDIAAVQKKLRIIYHNYGLSESKEVADAILQQQQRVLDWRSRIATQSDDAKLKKFSAERVVLIKQQINWVKQNKQLLAI